MTQVTLRPLSIILHTLAVILIVDLLNALKFNTTEVSKVIWVTQFLNWIIRPRTHDEKTSKAETVYSTRIKYLVVQLERDQVIKKQVTEVFEFVLLRLLTPNHIAYTGISAATSFQQELFHRLEEKVLPAKPLSASFESLLLESFPEEDESVLIDQIDRDALISLIKVFDFSQHFKAALFKSALAASHRVSRDLVQTAELLRQNMNLNQTDLLASAEFKIEAALRAELIRPEESKDLTIQDVSGLLEKLQSCENALIELVEGHQRHGIKIEIVYGLQSFRKRAQRLRLILQLFEAGNSR